MSDALSLFSLPTAIWFADKVGHPTLTQTEGWPAIASGEHALISAPTGTGKTLAAFLLFVDRLNRQAARGGLKDELHVLYISPLKALGNDIRENLKKPIEGIPTPGVRVAVRTGDTDAKARRDMIKRPPHILITTPESLFLLLTSASGRRMLSTCQSVILDELHAMIDTKRGAHLMLSLARLDALCGKPLQRVALSATIRPLERAAAFLAHDAPVRIVAPKIQKDSDILVQSAIPDMRQLPEGTIWPELFKAVLHECEDARTVIVFVEGRATAEKLAHGVNLLAGEGFARTHHGCVSKEQRLEAEQKLRSGALRLLVATSSMELGIDVGEVDKVLQIGNPLTVSGALQRLGRAGHNPGRTSVMRIFPRTGSEGLGCAMTATAAMERMIEPCDPPENCLDIVAQHLVSMAASGTWTVTDMHRVVSAAHSFRGVTFEDVEAALRMLAGDFEHQQDRPARPRVVYDRIHGNVSGDAYSRMLAVSSGGTIPDRGWFPAVLADGTRLGELDEEFVFEHRVGNKFLLGAFAWRIEEIKKDRVVVSAASTDGAEVPFWKGDGKGRSYEVGLRFGEYYRALNDAHLRGKLQERLEAMHATPIAALNAIPTIERQIEATGQLPDDRTLILEHFADQNGEHQLMVHSVFGQRVNAGLGMLMQRLAERLTGLDVQLSDDDEGLMLYVNSRMIPDGLIHRIDPATARDVIEAMLPASPLFTMSFRYNAFRALMMGARRGGRVPLWVQRLRGAEALSDAALYMDHPLMRETMRECMDDYLDLDALTGVLQAVQTGRIAVHELHTAAPSPMALPLRRRVEANLLYEPTHTLTPKNALRASDRLLDARDQIVPAASLLELAPPRPEIRDANRLHAVMMAEGDLVAGETDAPVEWLEQLAAEGRALYVEPGLWIAAEQQDLYRAALEAADFEARKRIVRRCLRFRGAQSQASLLDRYLIPEADGQVILDVLALDGAAVAHGEVFYHTELYQRAVRDTVAMRRSEVQTRDGARFAQLLAAKLRLPGSPQDRLSAAIAQLIGLSQPIEAWESLLLPARVAGYRPQLLDELLARGEVCWSLSGSSLSFHPYEDIDWSAEPALDGVELEGDQKVIYDALKARGATFAHMLTPLISGRSSQDALLALMEKGLVRCDSFAPVRLMLGQRGAKPGKMRARLKASAPGGGRWELARPVREMDMEGLLRRSFDRYGLLSRETCEGVRWADALQLLRIWEYTGKVRRGYYIRGLSGAQFIRAEDYERLLAQLSAPDPDITWLHAADPFQPWGRLMPHDPERSFILVPGTAVALVEGLPVMVFERGGEVLRMFDEAQIQPALTAFVKQFALGRVYQGQVKLCVKKYPESAETALRAAGFHKEMLDFVLWKGLGAV